MKKVEIGKKIRPEDVCAVALNSNIKVELDPGAMPDIIKSRKRVEEVLASNSAVYGINTGFGSLSDVKVEKEGLKQLQVNLIRSHCAGVGKNIDKEYARAMMLLRAHNISLGFSGVRLEVINSLLFFLNNDITPLIPEKGSVGASGDLAPLAHLTLCLMGEGEVLYKGEIKKSHEIIKQLGGKILELEAKEGLALINGTQFMASFGNLGLIHAESLLKHADIISALTIDGVKGTFAPFDIRISKIRPHNGQMIVSKNITELSKGSKIAESHFDCNRVQDPYSLRCIPQVHGAVRDAIAYLRKVVETEINSVTDNPLVFDDVIVSGGNFHGEPIALALDFATIAMSEIGSISERRVDKILTPSFNGGLPAYLVRNSGINSGFMIAQYTSAALVNENKVLSYPSSVDSIPTSNNKEDHVSMGATGARKFIQVLDNIETILAIELMAAVEACEQRKPLETSKSLSKVIDLVRAEVPSLLEDRVISGDINKIKQLIKSNKILAEVNVE
ncbi:MAG: histidine ammonia-lyase [bacterium]